MLINSEQFGQVEVPESEIIIFPQGLYGFEDLTKFVLLGKTGESNPFMWLHAVDDPKVCFVVIDPFVFKEDYAPAVGDEVMEIIETENYEDIRFLSIVVVPEDVKRMTANLKSPIVINSVKNIAVQAILNDEKYGFKHYVLEEMKKGA